MLINYKNIILIILLVLISLIIIILIISLIECRILKISEYFIKNIKNNDKLRIVFISDFHNKNFKNNNLLLIDKIINLKPDYIIIGGDLIDFSRLNCYFDKVDYINAIKFIDNLSSRINNINNYNFKRICFSFGNHELRLRLKAKTDIKLRHIYDELINCLNRNNVTIVDNSSYKLSNGICLSGLSLYEGYYGNILTNKYDFISKKVLDETYHDFFNDCFNIIAFHKPDYSEDLIDYGFDLVLSGHNHGGLINFPKFGAIFSPELKFLPKYNMGLYNYKNRHIIVTAGLGEHFIKVRVNNKPEICLLNIE